MIEPLTAQRAETLGQGALRNCRSGPIAPDNDGIMDGHNCVKIQFQAISGTISFS